MTVPLSRTELRHQIFWQGSGGCGFLTLGPCPTNLHPGKDYPSPEKSIPMMTQMHKQETHGTP